MEEFTELGEELAGIQGAPTDPVEIQAATMKLLGRYVFEQLRRAPEMVKKLTPTLGLLAQNDRNAVRREWLKFARERFQLNTVEQALKALPDLQALAEARRSPQTRRFEEGHYWNGALRNMFGAGSAVDPEKAQEEAEMPAANSEREATHAPEARTERIAEAQSVAASGQNEVREEDPADAKTAQRAEGKENENADGEIREDCGRQDAGRTQEPDD